MRITRNPAKTTHIKTHIEKQSFPIKLPGPSPFKDTRKHRQHSTQHFFRHSRHDIILHP